MTTESNTGPLAGVKVLDLSRILTGPYCTMALADFGAEVIKIERPGAGDDTRHWGPPFIDGESAYYLSINRNKQSVTVNIATDEGREIIHKLARDADVVVENFRPGTAERLGVGYEQLRQINPRIIYCSISGFGQTGPYRDRPGYDALAQAMSGMMSITGDPDGPPTKHGMSIADIGAGMWALFAISSALFHREKTGQGQAIDVALMDAQISWLTYAAGNYFASGQPPARFGSAHPSIVPYQPFETSDGYIMIAVGNDRLWQQFCEAAGHPELIDKPGYATGAERVTNREEVIATVAEIMRQHSTDDWMQRLETAGVPAGPISTIDEVMTNPHVHAREMVIDLEHPTLGTIKNVGNPAKLSETPARYTSAPPLLGQHTDQILKTLGYTPDQITTLRTQGII